MRAMKEEIIKGLKAGKVLCLLNIKGNIEERKIINELQKENLIIVEFEDFPEQQFSQYKIKWKSPEEARISGKEGV